jgi:asparagine synthetase B (glutamine-hydrolysing)
MCGLFGFSGRAASAHWLEVTIAAAQRRGPHGTGAFVDGATCCYRLGGWDSALLAHELAGASRILGHARLATFGSYRDPEALQPVVSGDLAFTHNGNVYNWRELCSAPCPSDSFALVDLLRRDRIDTVIGRIDAPSLAIAVQDAAGLYLYRHRLPLFLRHEPEGYYWCSWPLPGFTPIPQDKVIAL